MSDIKKGKMWKELERFLKEKRDQILVSPIYI
jgi:hypothetical protein